MFEVSVTSTFRASHALMLRGEREPVHVHDWRVLATVAGESLDEDGLVVDFHELEQALERIVRPWEGTHLNDVLPGEFSNASAEQVAACIAMQLRREPVVGAQLKSVSVTEAPNCVATYVV